MSAEKGISAFSAMDTVLEGLDQVSLEEMDSIKLMNRVDSKFVTNLRHLELLLTRASESGYRALVTAGSKVARYDTLYYDTAGREFYLMHHNGRLVRQKVRVRSYLNSGQTFLEIKNKNNHGRNKKKRIVMPAEHFSTVQEEESALEFLRQRCLFDPSELFPALNTVFERITLVNRAMSERITIDSGLTFDNVRTGVKRTLGDAVIIELKQDSLADSQMLDILLDLRIHPLRMSKYCIGSALTDPDLKQNRFKNKIRTIEKIID